MSDMFDELDEPGYSWNESELDETPEETEQLRVQRSERPRMNESESDSGPERRGKSTEELMGVLKTGKKNGKVPKLPPDPLFSDEEESSAGLSAESSELSTDIDRTKDEQCPGDQLDDMESYFSSSVESWEENLSGLEQPEGGQSQVPSSDDNEYLDEPDCSWYEPEPEDYPQVEEKLSPEQSPMEDNKRSVKNTDECSIPKRPYSLIETPFESTDLFLKRTHDEAIRKGQMKESDRFPMGFKPQTPAKSNGKVFKLPPDPLFSDEDESQVEETSEESIAKESKDGRRAPNQVRQNRPGIIDIRNNDEQRLGGAHMSSIGQPLNNRQGFAKSTHNSFGGPVFRGSKRLPNRKVAEPEPQRRSHFGGELPRQTGNRKKEVHRAGFRPDYSRSNEFAFSPQYHQWEGRRRVREYSDMEIFQKFMGIIFSPLVWTVKWLWQPIGQIFWIIRIILDFVIPTNGSSFGHNRTRTYEGTSPTFNGNNMDPNIGGGYNPYNRNGNFHSGIAYGLNGYDHRRHHCLADSDRPLTRSDISAGPQASNQHSGYNYGNGCKTKNIGGNNPENFNKYGNSHQIQADEDYGQSYEPQVCDNKRNNVQRKRPTYAFQEYGNEYGHRHNLIEEEPESRTGVKKLIQTFMKALWLSVSTVWMVWNFWLWVTSIEDEPKPGFWQWSTFT